MSRSKEEIISEMVDSGLFSDDEIRQAIPKNISTTTTQPRKNDENNSGIFREIAKSIVDSPTLPIAGGVIGGIAGIPSGPGAIGTATLGGAAGEAYRQLAARKLGMDSPKTSLEAAKKIGISGAEQGASEAIGMGIGQGAKLIGKIPIVKSAVSGVKSLTGDLFKLVTNMNPEDASILFKNPSAILPGAYKKAQVAWRAAAEKIGIPVDDINPEMIKILSGDAKKIVFDTYGKILSGETVTAAEAQTAKQALDIAVMPQAKTIRKNPIVNTLSQIRKEFVKRIGEESPEMAAANKKYAIASAGKKFRSFFPRNLNDTPAYFRSSLLPASVFGYSAAKGDPIEGMLRAGLISTTTSPLAIGSLISLASTVSPYARRSLISSLVHLANQKNNQ